jgi:hypothetical protein
MSKSGRRRGKITPRREPVVQATAAKGFIEATDTKTEPPELVLCEMCHGHSGGHATDCPKVALSADREPLPGVCPDCNYLGGHSPRCPTLQPPAPEPVEAPEPTSPSASEIPVIEAQVNPLCDHCLVPHDDVVASLVQCSARGATNAPTVACKEFLNQRNVCAGCYRIKCDDESFVRGNDDKYRCLRCDEMKMRQDASLSPMASTPDDGGQTEPARADEPIALGLYLHPSTRELVRVVEVAQLRADPVVDRAIWVSFYELPIVNASQQLGMTLEMWKACNWIALPRSDMGDVQIVEPDPPPIEVGQRRWYPAKQCFVIVRAVSSRLVDFSAETDPNTTWAWTPVAFMAETRDETFVPISIPMQELLGEAIQSLADELNIEPREVVQFVCRALSTLTSVCLLRSEIQTSSLAGMLFQKFAYNPGLQELISQVMGQLMGGKLAAAASAQFAADVDKYEQILEKLLARIAELESKQGALVEHLTNDDGEVLPATDDPGVDELAERCDELQEQLEQLEKRFTARELKQIRTAETKDKRHKRYVRDEKPKLEKKTNRAKLAADVQERIADVEAAAPQVVRPRRAGVVGVER